MMAEGQPRAHPTAGCGNNKGRQTDTCDIHVLRGQPHVNLSLPLRPDRSAQRRRHCIINTGSGADDGKQLWGKEVAHFSGSGWTCASSPKLRKTDQAYLTTTASTSTRSSYWKREMHLLLSQRAVRVGCISVRGWQICDTLIN